MRIDFVMIKDCIFWSIDKHAAFISYDDSLAQSYPSASVGYVINCQLNGASGASGSSVSGAGFNLSACESFYALYNMLANISNGDRNDFEPIYSKARFFYAIGNVLVDAGESQGCIAMKGNPGDVDAALVQGNTIIANTGGTIEAGLWLQSDNITVEGNYIYGDFVNAAIAGQTASQFTNTVVRNNTITVTDATAFGAAMDIRGDREGVLIEGNRVAADISSGTMDLITIEDGNSAGREINNAIIRNNTLVKENAGTIRGVTFNERAGAINDARVLNNVMFDLDVGIRTEGNAITLISEGNRETGVGTNVDNTNASTITTETTF